MGVSSSLDLRQIFCSLQKWDWDHVDQTIDSFIQGDYSYDLSIEQVESIMGLARDDSQQLITALSRQELATQINGALVLSAIIMLAQPSSISVDQRKQSLFRMMDFNRRGNITLDELEILLFCVGTVSACVLNQNADIPRVGRIKELTVHAGEVLALPTRTSELNLDIYNNWSREVAHGSSTMNEVFLYFVRQPQDRSSNPSLAKRIEDHPPT